MSVARHRGRPEIRPSGRVLVNAVAVIAGLVGLATLTGDVWLLLLACLGAGAVAVDAVLPLPGACLHVLVVGPASVRVGTEAALEMTVLNAGTRPSRACLVQMVSPLLDVEPIHVGRLQPGEQVEVGLLAGVVRRGWTENVDVQLVKGGTLGLLSWKGQGSRPLDLVAGPAAAQPWEVADNAGTSLSPGGRPVVRPGGVEVHGVRDWRPGDPSRHVHWRSTARRGRLVVTDRFDEVGGDVVLVVAAPYALPGQPDLAWEDVVARLAATAEVTLRAGGAVSLVAAIHGVPDLHTRDHAAVLDWCARLPPADAVLPPGDEAAALDRAQRVAGPGARELVVRTPGAAALRALTASAAPLVSTP